MAKSKTPTPSLSNIVYVPRSKSVVTTPVDSPVPENEVLIGTNVPTDIALAFVLKTQERIEQGVVYSRPLAESEFNRYHRHTQQ